MDLLVNMEITIFGKKLINEMIKDFKSFKLYEFEETENYNPEQVKFMDDVYKRINNEIVPQIPKEYAVTYDRKKLKIDIKTDNKNDLSVGTKIVEDKIIIYANPIGEPKYEFNYSFFSMDVDNVIKSLLYEFTVSDTNGLYKSSSKKSRVEEDDETISEEPIAFIDDDDDDILDKPILDKPRKRKRSIDISVIKDVLEDAYIMDDIDLKNTSIEELVRRMLLESRRKTK